MEPDAIQGMIDKAFSDMLFVENEKLKLKEKIIDLIYTWSTEHEHQVCPPYDWALLGKRIREL